MSNLRVSFRPLLLIFGLVIFLFVAIYSLFIYYNYRLLTNRIDDQTLQINQLQADSFNLSNTLNKIQHDLDLRIKDLADISWPQSSENLLPQKIGFSSPYIDNKVSGTSDFQYQNQTGKFYNTNIAIPELTDKLLTFQEYVYNREPYFTLYSDQELSNQHLGKVIPIVLDKNNFAFTSSNGLKVYRFNLLSFGFTFTSLNDHQPRLVILGLQPPASLQDTTTIIKKVIESITLD